MIQANGFHQLFPPAQDAGANATATVNRVQNAPLAMAVFKDSVPLVKLLLEAGADPDLPFAAPAAMAFSEFPDTSSYKWFSENDSAFFKTSLVHLAKSKEVAELLRSRSQSQGSGSGYRLETESPPPSARGGSLSDFDTLGNVTLPLPKFADMSQPVWAWESIHREEWINQPACVKARLLIQQGLEPLPSMANRQRSLGLKVRGKAPQPEEPLNLHPEVPLDIMQKLEVVMSQFFRQQVILTPGGSSSRKTDLASSDWDFYFEVPGIPVTTNIRDKLLECLKEKMELKAKLSERRIAVQLQINSTLIELVPRNASYFDWTAVDFPLFLGSDNRSKIDADLGEFLRDNAGARVAIRELKAAFANISGVPSFLVEHLVKRMAMQSILLYSLHGFVFEWRLPEAFTLLCHTLEELATFESRPKDPFSPLQDLLDDLQFAEPPRRQRIRAGLDEMATLARNVSWANRFLFHVEFLINAQRHSLQDVLADPRSLPPPHTAYSLFLECQVGRENFSRFLDLANFTTPSLMQDRTPEDMLALQLDPDLQKANPASGFFGLDRNESEWLEFMELNMEFWEASMKWWNMSDCERRPWQDMHQFQQELFRSELAARAAKPMQHPVRLHRAELHPIKWYRMFVRGLLAVKGICPELQRQICLNKLQRFQNSPYARHNFELEDV